MPIMNLNASLKHQNCFFVIQVYVHTCLCGLQENTDRREVKKFEVLDKANLERGSGGIVCMCEEVDPIDTKNCFIPCNLI